MEEGVPGWKLAGITAQQYVSELLAYDAEIQKDAFVLGATVFTAGAQGGDWRDYDTDGLALEKVFGWTPAPQPPKPAPPKGATPMPKLWLALTPSNQSYNKFSGTDEQRQMNQFADAMATVASRYDAITCKVFAGQAETDTDLNPMLHAQLDRAYGWLNTAPAGTFTVGLGLHTDSGTTVQVGSYWGFAAITARLAVALREQLRIFFPGSQARGGNYEQLGYQQWTRAYGKHCPVILELGSHQVPAMVARLAANPSQLAMMLVDALLAFFALPKTLKVVPVDPVTDALNGAWQFATLAEGAPNLDVARTNATKVKEKIVALKIAIGKQ